MVTYTLLEEAIEYIYSKGVSPKQWKMLLFLVEGIAHYNSTNLCIGSIDGSYAGVDCRYSPETVDKVGVSEGCWIGRHTPYAKEIDEQGTLNNSLPSSQLILRDSPYLPDWMKELNPVFTDECQRLHDISYHWNKEGLSYHGEIAALGIIASKIAVDELQFWKDI